MIKLKQFSNEFDVLYSREDSPWMGECRAARAGEPSSWGIWGRSEFYRMLEEASSTQGMIG